MPRTISSAVAVAAVVAVAVAAVAVVCSAVPAPGPMRTLTLSAKHAVSADDPYGDPGVFDSYVFAMPWTPQYCSENPTSSECTRIKKGSYASMNFGLHGLWPQYNDPKDGHEWPQFCHENDQSYWNKVSQVLPKIKSAFESQWNQYAPGYFTDLVDHEWTKHGTCALPAILKANASETALYNVQNTYFSAQMSLMKSNPTPTIVSRAATSGGAIPIDELIAAFGTRQNVGLKCDTKKGKAYLDQVELCYAKDSNGLPTTRINCPSTVLESSYDNSCVYDSNIKQVYVAKMF